MNQHPRYLFLVLVLGLLITACRSPLSGSGDQAQAFATPTVHALFAGSPSALDAATWEPSPAGEVPTIAPIFANSPTEPPTAQAATATPDGAPATPMPQPTLDATQLVTGTIYGDSINPAWTLNNSVGVTYSLFDATNPHSGLYALAVSPTLAQGQLAFAVREDAVVQYPRDQVYAVRFWLGSGDGLIETDDLAVSILGSNQYPYWVAGDTSVQNAADLPTFSQTRLYFLGVNTDIPPQTWVPIEIVLDELLYDPDYAYVVGIWLYHDDLPQPYYIDNLQLLLLADAETR